MPPTLRYQRQGQLVVVRGQPVGPTVYDYYPKTTATIFGAIQIVCGAIQLGLIVPSIVYHIYGLAEGMMDSTIWAILAGSFNIAAGRRKTSCKVATGLVLSILAAVASSVGSLMIVSIVLVNKELDETYGRHNAILILMAIVSAVEAVVSISSSVIACHFSCLCCKNCCCRFDVTTTQEMLLYDTPADQCELRGVVTISNEDHFAPPYVLDNGEATGDVQQPLSPPDYKQ